MNVLTTRRSRRARHPVSRQRCLRAERLENRLLLAGEPLDPPIIDFPALPDVTETNIDTFLIAGMTEPNYTLQLNGNAVPPEAVDDLGVFSFTTPLEIGTNDLVLTIESDLGQPVETISKTVDFDPSLSTVGRRLLYVDVVANTILPLGPSPVGTVVIDLDGDTVLGLLKGQHVRGISPDGLEIYMENNMVLSAASHQPLRELPFTQDIPLSGFIVSPDGAHLYAGNEVVEVRTNTLEQNLPINIATGSAWAGASVAGGPAISPDGSILCAQNAVVCVDLQTRDRIDTEIIGHFMSDIEFSADGSQLIVTEYSFANGRVDFYDYDAGSFSFTESIPPTIGGLGDFAGKIGLLANNKIVIGSSGNPRNRSGRVNLIDLDSHTITQQLTIPLANNLATSGVNNEVFVSTGATDAMLGHRLGVDVLVVSQDGNLDRTKTFFLGVNRFLVGSGQPRNDQIRRILYRTSIDIAPRPVSDLTGDGFVDFQDLTILLANWNRDVTAEFGNIVDPDTTTVNFKDLTVLLADWTGQDPDPAPGAANAQLAVAAGLVGRDGDATGSNDDRAVAAGEVFDRLGRRDSSRRVTRAALVSPLRRLQAVAVDRAMVESDDVVTLRRGAISGRRAGRVGR